MRCLLKAYFYISGFAMCFVSRTACQSTLECSFRLKKLDFRAAVLKISIHLVFFISNRNEGQKCCILLPIL